MMSDVKKLFFELTLLVLVLVIGCTVLFSLPAKPLDCTVHVVISVDINQSQGLLPLIQSLKEHCSIRIMIHIVCSTKDLRHLQQWIECMFSQTEYFQIKFVEYDLPEEIVQLIKIRSHGKQYLASSANFVRFFFPKLFPSRTHILYLDVDTIVKHDISELWNQVIATEKLLVAVPREGNISTYFNLTAFELYKGRYGMALDKTIPDYNAGVLGINLEMWRRLNLREEAIYWMNMNKEYPLYHFGTQPILYLVVGNNWDRARKNWNVDGLGWKRNDLVPKAFILHWSGGEKPWHKHSRHVKYWSKYRDKVCKIITEKRCPLETDSIGIC